jgi:carboxypeptidase Taq
LTPVLHAFYPDQLSEFGYETLSKHFNWVSPGLIRVEADEVTYNLHIALRFEIENKLINSKIKVEDLPEIWRAKMKKYLGVVPKTDREGILQDVHWSTGAFGYFPTYTLGNLYAAQVTAKMSKELKIKDLVERAEFGTILSWLRTNIHQYGNLYWPKELIKKITGEPLNPKYLLDYLQKKYFGLYIIE